MQDEPDRKPEETSGDPEFVTSANRRAAWVLIGIFAGALAILIGVELIRRI